MWCYMFTSKETAKFNNDGKGLLSVLALTHSVGDPELEGCIKLFPRALMKRTQLIDGEREGSGN